MLIYFKRTLVTTLLVWGGLIFLTGLIYAEPSSLDFSYSYSCYAEKGEKTTVEFFFRFSENGLTYSENFGRLLIDFKLYDTLNQPIDSYLWMVDHETAEGGPVGKIFGGRERFEASPGIYYVKVRLTDALQPTRFDTTSFQLEVRRFDRDKIALSDIDITTEMAPTDDTTHPFARGNYILMRNIDGIIGPPEHRLNSYVEIYNADKIPASQFDLLWIIADSTGKGVYLHDTLIRRPSTSSIFEINSVVVNGLKSGWYILAAKVFNGRRNSGATDSAEVVRGFWVWNPKIDSLTNVRQELISERMDLIDPLYSGMKEEELDREYAVAEYLMSETKRNVWKSLSGTEPKSRFLTQFWLALDDDLTTPENPFRDDYFERVDLARKLYYSQTTPKGWDSDRGRVLLTYGTPDGVERRPNEQNRRPYEIWTYNSLQIEFVFVDMGSTGSYKLVHSTGRNEIQYPEWERDYVILHDQWYREETGDQGF
ncbi:MAG: GWxTD domain-containing protein [Ignavibacteriae bacterium]|nr:GWxTD domain-containing protein [Ignavibacteriota bacterium]MCB9216279.1 GWxTD domain-containing protein [Ignavibacteria bacterium]